MNEIYVAALTGSFTLLGVGITLWFERKRSLLEYERWYTDHFIGDKLEQFRRLHAALVDCYFTMNFYGNVPPQTLTEFREKVSPKEDAYLRHMVLASIYLSEEDRRVFCEALGAFRQASMAIFLHLPAGECPAKVDSYGTETKNMNWRLFKDTYEAARRLLEGKLNPALLKLVESRDVAS